MIKKASEVEDEFERQLAELEDAEKVVPQQEAMDDSAIQTAVVKAEKSKRSKKEKVDSRKAAEPTKKAPVAMDFVRQFVEDHKTSNRMIEDESDAYVDIGHIGLNYLASGRFLGPMAGGPRRKLWETFGPSGSLKSAKGYITGGNIQRLGGIFAVVDAEGARNLHFMKLCGVDIEACINLVPVDKDGDDCYAIGSCFGVVKTFISYLRSKGFDGPIFVLIDSIAAAPSMDEWMQLKSGKEVKEDQGRRAKTINQFQRVMNSFLRNGDNTVEIINQVRAIIAKPGQFFGPTETTTSGRSTEYFSDFRIDTRKRKAIQRNTFDAKTGDGEGDGEQKGRLRKIGSLFAITSEKSRQTAPHRHIPNLEFFFDHGIAPMSGLFELLKTDEWIIQVGKGGSVYAWADPISRLSASVKPMEGIATFRKKDFEECGWIMDNAHLFGTNRETIETFVSARRQVIDGMQVDPHDFSLKLKKLREDDPSAVQEVDADEVENDEDDQLFDRQSKVGAMANKSGGTYHRAMKSTTASEDETPRK